MSFLDIDAFIIDVSKLVEFHRSPITDIKGFTNVDVGIVEGSVGNEEEEEIIRELRHHSKIIMAWVFTLPVCFVAGLVIAELLLHG
jgi:NAD-reducing hydrogenase small subunit